MIRVLRATLYLLAFLSAAFAQPSAQRTVESRSEEIQAERKKKAAELQPEVVSKTEQWFIEFREKHILAKIQYGIGGLRARVGALVTGSGFAFGPEFYRDDLADG